MSGHARYDPVAGRAEPLPTTTIRPATRGDVPGLLAFDMTVVVRTEADWLDALAKTERGERLLLVAEVAGEIAAFGQAHHLAEHPDDRAPAGWHLTGVTVLPRFRRGGLGRRLTQARLDWIAERSDLAWYMAAADNPASIRLHEQLGFVEVSRASSIHGVAFECGEGVLFRRRVTPDR